MFVCYDCRVLLGRGLCDELITRPDESYRMWCVVVCDLETSLMRMSWPAGGCRAGNNSDLCNYQECKCKVNGDRALSFVNLRH